MSVAGKGFLVCAYSSGNAEPGFIKAKVHRYCWPFQLESYQNLLMNDPLLCLQVEALGAFLSTSLDQINV